MDFPALTSLIFLGLTHFLDGTYVAWFEPPPVEVLSDHNLVHYASNTTKLPLATTNVPLSWNFSVSSGLFFISLNLRLNGENIGVVPPAGAGQPRIISPFGQRFSLNWIPSEKVTLTIFNVTADDNGTFACELALFEIGSGSNIWKSIIPVQVLVPPEITNTSGNQTVTEGDNVTLNCEAAVGNPQPRINWTKVSNNSAVTFPLVISRQDQGFFRCTANNDVGNPASKDVFVTVHYPPNITYISGNQTVNQTDSVTLSCLADGNPAPRITWTRVSDNSAFTFPLTITGKGDEGAYSCTADNDVKDSFSKDTFIIVQNYSPLKPSLLTDLSGNTAVVDSPFNLTCSAEANPPPSYRFYRDETSLDTSAVEVYTTLVSEKKSPVNYSCTPFNEYGEGPTGRITVKVHYPPVATVNETIKVPNGSVVVILCDVSGNPPPDIFWYEGKNVSDGRLINHEKRLFIKVVSNEKYICSANNSLGSVTARVDVVVVVVMKITFTIRDKDCNDFNEVSKESVRNETFRWLEPFGITDVKMDTRRGSVIVDLELSFTQSVTVDQVVETLKNAASQSDFGGFNVDPESIRETGKVVSTTGAPTSATTDVNFLLQVTLVDAEYLQDYENVNSEPAQQLISKFLVELDKLYDDDAKYDGTEVTKLSKGSVIVSFEVLFKTPVTANEGLAKLRDAVNNDKRLGNFTVEALKIIQPVNPTTATSTEGSTDTERCQCNEVIWKAVTGVLIFINILLVVVIIWQQKRGSRGQKRPYALPRDDTEAYDNEIAMHEVQPSHSRQSKTEYMDLKEITAFESKRKEEVTLGTPQVERPSLGTDYAPLHPSTRSWEIPRNSITIEKVIGKGAFGQVAKGTAIDLWGSPGNTPVAVKMLKASAPESDRSDLLSELELMKTLKPHRHVIRLLGCVTETEPLLVLIEYVPYGDLLGYLRKSRGLNDTYFKDPDIKPRTNLTSEQLMKFAWQIADGMSYLSSRSIIHRDLAARNVLVGERETCKVTDFGMARNVQQENIYERKTRGRLPVKWTAYEALMFNTYTPKSDVWSYGVLLYEIFTVGGSPYPRMDGKKIAGLLQQGYRMLKPQHVDDKLYQIMMNCWQNEPEARPSFTDLTKQLKDMENQHKKLINMHIYDNQLYARVEDLNV